MVSERLHITAHPRMFSWRRDGITQPGGKGNLHVFGDIENSLYPFFYVIRAYAVRAEDTHYLKANSQGLGHLLRQE